MIKLLKFIGKFLGALLIPILILASFASILLLSFESQVFNKDFYQKVFSSDDFFNQLPEVASVQIEYAMSYNPCLEDPGLCEDDDTQISSSSNGPPSYFQALSQNDWELLIRGILPPEWIEDKFMEVTDGLIQATDSDAGDLSIVLSLKDLKDRLGGPDGIDAIVQVLDTQPECNKEDLLRMTRILEGNEDPGEDFLSCHPPDDFIETHSSQLEVLLRRSLHDVPDKIDLGKSIFSMGQETSLEVFDYEITPLLLVQWIRWSIWMSPLLCIATMLIIGLLAVHSFKELGGWWGYPLAISGLFGLGLALLASPLVSWSFNIIMRGQSVSGISPVMIETGSGLVIQIVQILFKQVRNFSLITLGIGMAIILSTSVLSTNGRSQVDDSQNTNSG